MVVVAFTTLEGVGRTVTEYRSLRSVQCTGNGDRHKAIHRRRRAPGSSRQRYLGWTAAFGILVGFGLLLNASQMGGDGSKGTPALAAQPTEAPAFPPEMVIPDDAGDMRADEQPPLVLPSTPAPKKTRARAPITNRPPDGPTGTDARRSDTGGQSSVSVPATVQPVTPEPTASATVTPNVPLRPDQTVEPTLPPAESTDPPPIVPEPTEPVPTEPATPDAEGSVGPTDPAPTEPTTPGAGGQTFREFIEYLLG